MNFLGAASAGLAFISRFAGLAKVGPNFIGLRRGGYQGHCLTVKGLGVRRSDCVIRRELPDLPGDRGRAQRRWISSTSKSQATAAGSALTGRGLTGTRAATRRKSGHSGPSLSLIICTKNRCEQLSKSLEFVAKAKIPEEAIEIVLVDNDSSDRTNDVIECFAKMSRMPVTYGKCTEIGLASARNFGVNRSQGDWLIFTDDDCYIEELFFENFLASVEGESFRYGSGQIILYDKNDDPRVANLEIAEKTIIPPNAFLPAGIIQGANMFFHRSVFQKTGLFNRHLGAGTPFPCEDIEMAARASLAGFVGAQLPGFKVLHHHGRKTGSPEALATIEGYDYGRGAYYASLLDKGISQVWAIWQSVSNFQGNSDQGARLKLARELAGASRYLEMVAKSRAQL